MTEDTISKLSKLFSDKIASFKRVSYDESTGTSMCESPLKVINFDRVPKSYASKRKIKCLPNSNDALYIDEDQNYYFIEFKNGKNLNRCEIYKKIYDSLIILIEEGIFPDIEFARKNLTYFLVYNQSKLDSSFFRKKNEDYLRKLGRITEERLLDIHTLEGYILKETHTWDITNFNSNFIRKFELKEKARRPEQE